MSGLPILQNSIPGIRPKILAKELKELEQNKLISRIVTAAYPVKISYQPEPYADTLTPHHLWVQGVGGITESRFLENRDSAIFGLFRNDNRSIDQKEPEVGGTASLMRGRINLPML